MRERPILFIGPMVRAILEGRKTQTRRLNGLENVNSEPDKWTWDGSKFDAECETSCTSIWPGECPYGQPGDRLWVREAFIHEKAEYEYSVSTSIPYLEAHTTYRADVEGDSRGAGWKPSIHMPRHLSRITLEITDVRVQRLQDISEEDCVAEGVELLKTNCDGECGQTPCGITRQPFIDLWESINGAESWAANPWLWVVSFQKTEAA